MMPANLASQDGLCGPLCHGEGVTWEGEQDTVLCLHFWELLGMDGDTRGPSSSALSYLTRTPPEPSGLLFLSEMFTYSKWCLACELMCCAHPPG